MTPPIDAAGVNELRALASVRFGLRFTDDKQDFLAEILRQRLEASKASSVGDYFRSLATDAAELQALTAALTVPETFFFRGGDQLRAFQEAILPDRIRRRAATRELRILSAGCATGEEPYTISMILNDSFPELNAWTVTVAGYDLNPRNLQHAARGRYSTWSLRETTPAARERCFRREGADFVVHDVYRGRVQFREVNLHDPPPDALPHGVFDVIFCRNVIMYFTPEVMSAVVGRLARALVPGGYLFLGHAETLRGLSPDFVLRHTHETFYYQRRDGSLSPAPDPGLLPSAGLPMPGATTLPAPDNSWVESIRVSSDRVETLSRELDRRPAPQEAPAPVSTGTLTTAVDLFRQERFRDALGIVAPLATRTPRDPEALLLQAVLLVHCGRRAEAEAACAEILRVDDLSAEAHHLMALCREQGGDLRGATEQYQIAQYLDPGFAMPRVHLGRIARRRGDLTAARRELNQALSLLQGEQPSRLLLFGGGFNREALLQLCRKELEACGGRE